MWLLRTREWQAVAPAGEPVVDPWLYWSVRFGRHDITSSAMNDIYMRSVCFVMPLSTLNSTIHDSRYGPFNERQCFRGNHPRAANPGT